MYSKSIFNENIYISSEISKKVILLIKNNKDINYRKLNLSAYENRIELLKKKFLTKKKNEKNTLRNNFFWDVIKKKYKNLEINSAQRLQKNKSEKLNINFQKIGKHLGFNPSILTLILFDKIIKNTINFENFYEELINKCFFLKIDSNERIRLFYLFCRKKITFITPLCPDYEYIKISKSLFKYTFEKLNKGVGLIGSRVIENQLSLKNICNKYKIKFEHHLFYGDFESYSPSNLLRLNLNEDKFINLLKKSAKKMKSLYKNPGKVYLLVDKLSSKNKWKIIHKNNYKKLTNLLKKNKIMQEKIQDILQSRISLYKSWYPQYNNEQLIKILLEQGAEYMSMMELFIKKFDNFCLLGFDHFRMKFFYKIIDKDKPVMYRFKYYD
jgi:hypothetical protein